MKNTMAKAVSIITLALSVTAIGPHQAMAREKKQTVNSTKRASGLISEVGFPKLDLRGRTGKIISPKDSASGSHRSTSNTRSNPQAFTLDVASSEVFELNTPTGKVPRSSSRRSGFNQPEQLPSSVSLK